MTQGLEEQSKEGYLDAELRARYLAHLGSRRRRMTRFLAVGATASAAATVATLAAAGPDGVAIATATSLGAAVLAGLGVLVAGDAPEETRWLERSAQWARRSAEWRALWRDALAGTAPSVDQVRRARQADQALLRLDTDLPRHERRIRVLQRRILRSEGFTT